MSRPSLADRIRRGEDAPFPLGLLLSLGTPVVRAGMYLRLARRTHEVAAKVISFGNLTAGGTGKTPAVIERARIEARAGHRVAVLTRGYGAGKQPEPYIVPPDVPHSGELLRAIGEEPALIRSKAPGVAIVRAADRVAGAKAAMVELRSTVLLLDDGFQHVRLARDENWLVIDATNPFGNGHLLPRGTLREPPGAMRRASGVMLTRCDQAGDLTALRRRIIETAPNVRIRETWHAPVGLRNLATGEERPVEALAGQAVHAACALGNPEAFRRTLEACGARVEKLRAVRDHAALPGEALAAGDMVVVTEKDAIRLEKPPESAWALAVELRDWPPGQA
jgi:tetraacyldisaccharide 4'-kinase